MQTNHECDACFFASNEYRIQQSLDLLDAIKRCLNKYRELDVYYHDGVNIELMEHLLLSHVAYVFAEPETYEIDFDPRELQGNGKWLLEYCEKHSPDAPTIRGLSVLDRLHTMLVEEDDSDFFVQMPSRGSTPDRAAYLFHRRYLIESIAMEVGA